MVPSKTGGSGGHKVKAGILYGGKKIYEVSQCCRRRKGECGVANHPTAFVGERSVIEIRQTQHNMERFMQDLLQTIDMCKFRICKKRHEYLSHCTSSSLIHLESGNPLSRRCLAEKGHQLKFENIRRPRMSEKFLVF